MEGESPRPRGFRRVGAASSRRFSSARALLSSRRPPDAARSPVGGVRRAVSPCWSSRRPAGILSGLSAAAVATVREGGFSRDGKALRQGPRGSGWRSDRGHQPEPGRRDPRVAQVPARSAKIYGARFGVRGILCEDFIDLTQATTHNLEQVARTPSSALGSTRDKPDEEYCRKLFAVMRGSRDPLLLLHRRQRLRRHLPDRGRAGAGERLPAAHRPRAEDDRQRPRRHRPLSRLRLGGEVRGPGPLGGEPRQPRACRASTSP